MTREPKPNKFPFVEPRKLRRAAVVCHRNADADAYLSAYSLSTLIRSAAPRCAVDIVTPEGMTRLTSKLAKRFPHRVVEATDAEYDLYVAVDVGDTQLLKEWRDKMKTSKGVKVLVDHHPLRDGAFYDHAIVDEGATSAAEVVFSLFRAKKARPNPRTAQALLEAIMFDSSHLGIAGAQGLRTVVQLLDRGADINLARRELRTEPDYGEVLAKLKGAQRLKIHKIGEWVASTSTIGSFQAQVARALVYLGADVAIAAGEAEGETRVSLRSTQRFSEATKIHLGVQVAEEVAASLGGHGGGHATAASFSTAAGEEEALTQTLKRVAALLGAEAKEL